MEVFRLARVGLRPQLVDSLRSLIMCRVDLSHRWDGDVFLFQGVVRRSWWWLSFYFFLLRRFSQVLRYPCLRVYGEFRLFCWNCVYQVRRRSVQDVLLV